MMALERAKKFVYYGGHIDILLILIGFSVVYVAHTPGTDILAFTALLFGATWVFIGIKWLDTDIRKASEDPK